MELENATTGCNSEEKSYSQTEKRNRKCNENVTFKGQIFLE